MTISSIPAIKFHGSGATVEAAREQAASQALKHNLDHSTTLKSFEETQGEINRVALVRAKQTFFKVRELCIKKIPILFQPESPNFAFGSLSGLGDLVTEKVLSFQKSPTKDLGLLHRVLTLLWEILAWMVCED